MSDPSLYTSTTLPMEEDVVNPIALQQGPQWPSNSSFCGFDDMDFMAPSDYNSGLPLDEPQISSPAFNRSVAPLNCLISPFIDTKSEYDDINQFLNPNPAEITSI